MKVNCYDSINSDSITTEDLQLLNNIIENDNPSVVFNDAKNLIEVIKIYKKF